MTQTSTAAPDIFGFDGPLALLVELIERSKVEITAVSLEKITSEYLDRVSDMVALDPGQLAEFVQLGSRLVYIKSLALLPTSAEAGEELVALEHDLAEYRRYREAADMLSSRLRNTRTWGKGSAYETPDKPIRTDVTLEQLSAAFQSALARTQPLKPTAVLKRHLDIASVMKHIRNLLKQGSAGLQSIIDKCQDRLEIVVTFLAILELIKDGSLSVEQTGQFGDITLREVLA